MEDHMTIETALADSLKKLAVSEPFEKITIQEIAQGAGVIRVTFYNHFKDKYGLLEWIVETQILDPVRVLFSNTMYREAVILIFTNLQKEKEFYMHVARMHGQNSLSEIAQRALYKLLIGMFGDQDLMTKSRTHPWLTPEYAALYYSHSMAFVVMEWIRSGMTGSPEEMGSLYYYIGTRSLTDIMEELKDNRE